MRKKSKAYLADVRNDAQILLSQREVVQATNMPTEEQTYRAGVIDRLQDLQESLTMIDAKITYTNGKLRKVIVALILVFGILIGQTFPTAAGVLQLFSNAIHI